VAQSPSDSSNTKISAFRLLSEEVALDSDRDGGDGSTPTLQKSEGQARSVALFPISSSPAGRRSERLLARGMQWWDAHGHTLCDLPRRRQRWGEKGGKPPLNPEQSGQEVRRGFR
jgi:hypothetical protein